ncbi:MAG: hypothetical protein ACXAD7_07570 [Candidatus Kariarchaeaceae archaeon]|jgi:hypothetical protein
MVLRNVVLQTPEGIPLFGRSLVCHIGTFCADLSQDSTFEDETVLKSALLTALLTVNEAERDQFHELPLAESKVLSYPTDNVIAVFEVNPDDEIESLKNRLQVMVELFKKNYGDTLDNFAGTISEFDSFEEILVNNGVLEEGEKFRKNCLNCKYSKNCTFRVATGPFYATILEKLNSIKDISIIRKMILMMMGMPGMMKYGMPVRNA